MKVNDLQSSDRSQCHTLIIKLFFLMKIDNQYTSPNSLFLDNVKIIVRSEDFVFDYFYFTYFNIFNVFYNVLL